MYKHLVLALTLIVALTLCLTAFAKSGDYRTEMPPQIDPPGTTLIIVNPNRLSWAAYNPDGNLVKSGPASAGSDWCRDLGRRCRTKVGTFTIYDKQDADCKSSLFPLGHPGAPMPYCMYFHGGMALHGSYEMRDYNASHGCVRLRPEDAKWLNHDFVEVGSTRVVIEPY